MGWWKTRNRKWWCGYVGNFDVPPPNICIVKVLVPTRRRKQIHEVVHQNFSDESKSEKENFYIKEEQDKEWTP